MAYVKCDDVMIPVFDGADYSSWKTRIIKFLEFKECEEVIKSKPTAENKKDVDWKKKNIKCMNYIYSAITNKILEYVSDLDTSFEIIEKFDSMYSKESTSLQLVCRSNLERLKMEQFKESNEFFDEFEKLINELKNAGGKIAEEEKLNYLLKALPRNYGHIGDLIDVLPKEERTCAYVMNKVKLKWCEEQTVEEEANGHSAFSVRHTYTAGVCHICGRAGHYMRDCYYAHTQAKHRGSYQRGRGARGARGNSGASANSGYGSTSQQQQQRGGYSGRGGYGSSGGFNGDFGRARASYQHSQQQQKQHGAGHQLTRGQLTSRRGRNGNNNKNIQQQHGCYGGDDGVTGFHVSVNSTMQQKKEERLCSENNVIDWLLDSGCSDHIVNNDSFFDKSVTLKFPIEVVVGDGRILKATKIGNISCLFEVYGKFEKVNMSNVYYVKDMKSNLLSYGKITKKNKIVSSKDTSKIFNIEKNKLVAIAYKEKDIYKLQSFLDFDKNKLNVNKVNKSEISLKEKWHRILGHINFSYLNILCKNNLLEGLPNEIGNEYMKCEVCIENKMHNLPFKNNRSRANNILELIHTDLNGPHKTVGNKGEKYFLTFIDDFSKLARVYTIKSKDEVLNYFIEYINEVENITNLRVKKMRCDNGTEYINGKIRNFAREKGIILDPCPAYVHELNGTAERYNRSIMNTARCLSNEAKVNIRFWPEIVKAAQYLMNRGLANTKEKKTPYEIFFNKKPNVENLKLYGSRVYVRKPEVKRTSKWDKKAELGILLGYCDVGYRVLINNRVIIARHVDIVEEYIKIIQIDDESESENVNDDSFVSTKDDSFIDSSDEKDKPFTFLRRSSRDVRPPERYGFDANACHIVYVNYCNANVPVNFEEAMISDECDEWKNAMLKEMKSIEKNNTWLLVDKPENIKALDVKWIYKVKPDGNYKARLVVRGFQQKGIEEEIYSPVFKMQTLKILLSVCCQNGIEIDQMDVETAFLNGKINSEVYVKQPLGFDDNSGKVYKLQKSLYGLKGSPRAWYNCINEYLQKLKFKRSEYDYCLYSKIENGILVYILLYVDDLLICCKDRKLIDLYKGKLSKKYNMKDLGCVKNYIGIDIEHKYSNEFNVMTLSQEKYIESVAKKFGIENSKLYDIPMENNLKLEPAELIDTKVKMRSLIGALLYISIGTRPDIAYSVNYLSRFLHCYDETHFKYALRILKYLYRTKEKKLTYERKENFDILDCFVDADWAGDIVDRKSTTGFVIRLFGNVVFWKSKKQNSVTKASTFAEYVALSEAITELKFIKGILKIFCINLEKPIQIYEDNLGAVIIAKNGNLSKNSKHIEVQYHFVHEECMIKNVEVVKIDTENNIADIFTKALGRIKFIKFREMLNVV